MSTTKKKSDHRSDALSLIIDSDTYGITVKELRQSMDWHHGVASSVLSTLHEQGDVARLSQRRDRCSVYVLKSKVEGRETVARKRNQNRASNSEPTPTPASSRYDDEDVRYEYRAVRKDGSAFRNLLFAATLDDAVNDLPSKDYNRIQERMVSPWHDVPFGE